MSINSALIEQYLTGVIFQLNETDCDDFDFLVALVNKNINLSFDFNGIEDNINKNKIQNLGLSSKDFHIIFLDIIDKIEKIKHQVDRICGEIYSTECIENNEIKLYQSLVLKIKVSLIKKHLTLATHKLPPLKYSQYQSVNSYFDSLELNEKNSILSIAKSLRKIKLQKKLTEEDCNSLKRINYSSSS